MSDVSDEDVDLEPVTEKVVTGTGTSHLQADVSSVSSQSESRKADVILYRLCGDNIDKTVRHRYMRTSSLHYFHSYAIADRIDFSNLSEERQPTSIADNRALAFLLLPSLSFTQEFQDSNFKNSLRQHSLLQSKF